MHDSSNTKINMYLEECVDLCESDDLTLSAIPDQGLCDPSDNSHRVAQMLKDIARDIRMVRDDRHGSYYYPIHLDYTWFQEHVIKDTIRLPHRVIQDLNNNRAKILCIDMSEGHKLTDWEDLILDKLLIPHNLSHRHAVILSATLCDRSPGGIVNIYHNLWESSMKDYLDHDPDILDKCLHKLNHCKEKAHNFICLIRKPRTYRLVLYANLYLYKDQGILTCGPLNHSDNPLRVEQQIHSAKRLFPSQRNNVLMSLKNTIPRIYDADITEKQVCTPRTGDLDIEKYLESHIHVVPETHFNRDNASVFLSEKIFKPMMFLQPFVVFGQANSLTELRRQGYKTFEPFIDESYDQILDHENRFVAALNQVKRLIAMSNDELVALQQQLISVLMHNHHHLINNHSGRLRALHRDLLSEITK